MDLQQIEELMKTVNKNAIKAMLRNAAILNDPNVSDEMKAQALENVKAIAGNKAPKKQQKVKTQIEAPVAAPTQLAQPPAPAAPAEPVIAAAPQLIQYPEGLHLSPLNSGGHDEKAMRGIFDSLPDHEKKSIVDWHASTKVQKSVESLYALFQELKKRL